MKTQRSLSPVLALAFVYALAPVQSARADPSTSHIALADPAKPAVLKIRLWHGEVKVHGADVKDVTVVTDSSAAEPPPRGDGMRVLSDSPGFRFSESHNVVSLEYGGESGEPTDVDLTVPRQTSIVVANSIRGDFECSGLSGDIDVRTMDGAVRADNVSGGVCVESMNGEIDVNMSALTASRPLCLSSMNGKITVRVPSASKATVNFRTHHGAILTNFDDKALVTRTDVVRRESSAEERNYRRDLAARRSPDAPPNPDAGSDLHAEIRDTIREATDQAAMAAQDAANAVHESLAEVHAELSKLPPLPPMTGGKVVSGSLNGGGVEIQAATLNGDIILKKGE